MAVSLSWECQVCMGAEQRRMHMLNCGHTFCCKCLEDMEFAGVGVQKKRKRVVLDGDIYPGVAEQIIDVVGDELKCPTCNQFADGKVRNYAVEDCIAKLAWHKVMLRRLEDAVDGNPSQSTLQDLLQMWKAGP